MGQHKTCSTIHNQLLAMTTLNSRLQLAMLNRKKARNLLRKGFTLVELMIVVVIVGILSGVALPSFLGQASKAKGVECTTAINSILTTYTVDAAEDKAKALQNAKDSADASTKKAGSNCDIAEPTMAQDALTVTATGIEGLADEYFAAACVNPVKDLKDIETSNEAAIANPPKCG